MFTDIPDQESSVMDEGESFSIERSRCSAMPESKEVKFIGKLKYDCKLSSNEKLQCEDIGSKKESQVKRLNLNHVKICSRAGYISKHGGDCLAQSPVAKDSPAQAIFDMTPSRQRLICSSISDDDDDSDMIYAQLMPATQSLRSISEDDDLPGDIGTQNIDTIVDVEKLLQADEDFMAFFKERQLLRQSLTKVTSTLISPLPKFGGKHISSKNMTSGKGSY